MPVFIDPDTIDNTEKEFLISSNFYKSLNAKHLDLAYQAIQKGIIPGTQLKRSELQDLEITDLKDNYLFVRRYFGKLKAFYIFFIRVLSFRNPILELEAFLNSLSHSSINLYKNINKHEGFLTFTSSLLLKKPLVSIVIPTLNRYPYLKDVLKDLEKQTYDNFEVLVCDQSDPLDEHFYSGWNLQIKLLPQKDKALWLARNKCIELSRGEYILLFDDDSRVASDWIEQHIRCIDYFQTSISAGVTHTLVGHGLSSKESYFHLSDVFDTGNAMVKRNVFKQVGLFDRQFEKQRMGDGEFGLRALLGGFPSVSNPYAKRIHLKVETGGLRQMGSWDAIRPKNLFAPRPIPSVLYYLRNYFGNKEAILYIVQNVPFSFIPYRFKKSKYLKLIALLLMPILLPLILMTSVRSWKAASEKLKQGPIIPSLS